MGKYKNGATGAFSGKLGNIIGSHWRNIDYMRSRPDHVSNPNTPAQQKQRGKFALIVQFLKKFKPVIRAGFDKTSTNRSSFNGAISYNLKNAVMGEVPDQQIDYPAVMVTRGDLYPPEGAVALSENPGEITFTWETNNLMGSASPDDEAVILLYNSTKERALYIAEDGPQRSEQTYTVTVPASHQGDDMEVYLSFVSADGEEVSSSVYLGSVTVKKEQEPEV
ncbi:MAG TPA: DUF6266 family protein [Balneolaceae bacterium]|nr:DUF6266 family protein [Balneolaceae bacterium]